MNNCRTAARSALLICHVLACDSSAASQHKPETLPPATESGSRPELRYQMNDYQPIPLARMIGTTEVVVIARLLTATSDQLELAVERQLIGSVGERIEVFPFVPSALDGPRAAPYSVGQRFVMFLSRDHDGDGPWSVRGLGGEGEMPLDSEYVYFHGRFVEGLERTRHRVHGAERDIQRVTAGSFASAVSSYQSCFRWEEDSRRRWQSEQTCDAATLTAYRNISPIHDLLVTQSERGRD